MITPKFGSIRKAGPTAPVGMTSEALSLDRGKFLPAARADEPGSGRVSGARTIELPRRPLASLACAAARAPAPSTAAPPARRLRRVSVEAGLGAQHAQPPNNRLMISSRDVRPCGVRTAA